LPDEVALNAVLYGSWGQLDPRWNVYPMTERLATPGFRYLGEDVIARADLPALEADAWILHYVSPVKPWTAAFPAGANKRRYEDQEAMVRAITGAASLVTGPRRRGGRAGATWTGR
jgi:lipopolysaccharide biosynthesis glycosyltransferase